jgi:hypothetical protein
MRTHDVQATSRKCDPVQSDKPACCLLHLSSLQNYGEILIVDVIAGHGGEWTTCQMIASSRCSQCGALGLAEYSISFKLAVTTNPMLAGDNRIPEKPND